MKKIRFILAALALCVSNFVSLTQAAPQEGWFGLNADAKTEGFVLNPTMVSIKILQVEANSPAAKAGVAAGDELIDVNGTAIKGQKAKDLGPQMEKAVGEKIDLKFKRADGNVYSVTLVAVTPPTK
jgi:C-terminal processing protease CtpA/Prc